MKLSIRLWSADRRWCVFHYRCDPVPGVNRHRWLLERHFSTVPEQRALVEPEHKRYSRARRHNLPDPWWEEIPRRGVKSWKKYRRHQWRG